MASSGIAICRLCFDSDETISHLISPCRCKGSSLYVHSHCLEKWQQISFESNNPLKAITCCICNTPYIYPSWIKLLYKRILYLILHYYIIILKSFCSTLYIFTIEPIKFIIYSMFLLFVILPWGYFSLGQVSITWIGNEFPPQLAIVCSGEPIEELTEGMIIVSTKIVPKYSMFHRTVILLLEYSPIHGARGVILNHDNITANNMHNRLNSNNMNDNQGVGYGGPVDNNQVTVIHDCKDLAHESDLSCVSEGIYVTEYDSTRRTLTHLSTKAIKLVKLYRVTAMHARQRLRACTNAATAYANRAKNRMTLSIHSAFNRVSGGRLGPLLYNPRNNNRSNRNLIEETPRVETNSYISPISNDSSDEAHLSTSDDEEINNSTSHKTNIRVVKGAARWCPTQLDGEIRSGLWHILPLRHKYIFPNDKQSYKWWKYLIDEAIKLSNNENNCSDTMIDSLSNSPLSEIDDSDVSPRFNHNRTNSGFFQEISLSLNEIMSAIVS